MAGVGRCRSADGLCFSQAADGACLAGSAFCPLLEAERAVICGSPCVGGTAGRCRVESPREQLVCEPPLDGGRCKADAVDCGGDGAPATTRGREPPTAAPPQPTSAASDEGLVVGVAAGVAAGVLGIGVGWYASRRHHRRRREYDSFVNPEFGDHGELPAADGRRLPATDTL